MKRKAIVALLCAVACDRCGPRNPPEDPPETGICDACAPRAYILWAQEQQQLGILTPPEQFEAFDDPADPEAACGDTPSTSGMEGVHCPLLTAHYLARTVQWDGSVDANARWCAATHVLPCEDGGAGCGSAAPIGSPANIVGVPEMETASPHASVALLVDEGLLAMPVISDAADPMKFDDAIADMFERDSEAGCVRIGTEADGPELVWPESRPCTAVLVAPGLVLTAGHCVGSQNMDTGKSLVFRYHNVSQDLLVEGDRYDNVQLVAHAGVQDAIDWALLSFAPDPADNLVPVDLPAGEGIGECNAVYAVGHPRGYPLRRSGGDDPSEPQAWPRGPSEEQLFRTTLDTIEGFSGSPVFSLTDDRLVGMVIRGSLSACPEIESDTESCDGLDETGAVQLTTVIDLAAVPEVLQARDEWCSKPENVC